MTNAGSGQAPVASISAIRPMVYEDAREVIQNGDLIAVRGNGGGLPALIRLVTRSPYYHTGIALWMEGRLLLVETRGVAALVPLSQYADNDFDVIRCPLQGLAGAWNVKAAVFRLLGVTIRYDFGALFAIAAHELLGVKLPNAQDGEMICSSLTASIYKAAGWNPAGLPFIPTPRDVVAAAGSVAIEVRLAV